MTQYTLQDDITLSLGGGQAMRWRAGKVLSDAAFNIPALKAAGAVLVPVGSSPAGAQGAVVDTVIVPGLAASSSSASSIVGGSNITRAYVNVSTAYSAGARLALGNSANSSLIASGIDLTKVGPQDLSICGVPWGSSALPLLASISGSPSVGACTILVESGLPQT